MVAAASIQKIHFVLPSAEEIERRLSVSDDGGTQPEALAENLPEGVVVGVGPVEGAIPAPEVPTEPTADERGYSEMPGGLDAGADEAVEEE